MDLVMFSYGKRAVFWREAEEKGMTAVALSGVRSNENSCVYR
ncbi:MAG: hypothetical protein PWP34_1236 [Desulfuromonadales bacterium]|jgi:hypothetical protein|nr:hypothetical protein [Desulfuromonadales bacterium]